jgi:serine/threonine protein kinase/TolB-like protein/cytochrome c-type biogenesis protein CcmH/NrfG
VNSKSRYTIAVGARMGAYEVLGPIAAGGMGEVYRARDTRLGREVAIKLLPLDQAQDPTARERIEREARIVASLNHPNILALHDIGTADGAMFFVTELVDGQTLGGLKLALRKCLEVGAQIADGLAAAHAAGVTHRDLKPDNVMLTRDGRVKLLDFGVALQRPTLSHTSTTASYEMFGVLTGTISYMAPEQVRAGEVDSRADIFSFGALLYELLAGRRAFDGETAADVMSAVLTADPAALPASVPGAVRDIVNRCLEKGRDERFQSARDLGFALRQAAAAISAGSDTDVTRSSEAPTPAAIREHLAVLLASPPISGAERLSALLRFVVEETLQGRQAQLKEMKIGLDVFGRKSDSYDPAFDPIVRVQMGRLRSKLRAYYHGPGSFDRVRIDVPLGNYVPVFLAAAGPVTMPRVEPVPAQSDEHRLAVLPIVNMSAEPETQYFCDGLTEELITHLAQIRQLRVVARTSSFQFKDAARDIREVGRLLDVSKVLEGSVRKSGNRIRVTVQLINVADGCHLWSERYESDLNDIFAIHENISTAVQRSLRQQVLGTERGPAVRKRPGGIEAYNEYLQGRFHWKKRTEEGLRTALDHFTRAVQLDPSFVRALSGIADCHLMLGMSAAEAPERSMPKAAEAARQALRIDDNSAETQASLAAVLNCFEWDLDAAEQGYRRAIALDPSYATAFHWLGLLWQSSRRQFADAVDSLEQAIELDPLSSPIIADTALVHAFRENFDAAAMYCRRALSLDAHFHRPYWFLGLANAWSGHLQAAEDALQQGLKLCPGAAFRARLLGALGFTYGQSGNRARADEVTHELERLRQSSYAPSFEFAQIEMGVGNHSAALTYLEDAVVHRESFAIFLNAWNTFAPLRPQPRFQALLAQIGLAA